MEESAWTAMPTRCSSLSTGRRRSSTTCTAAPRKAAGISECAFWILYTLRVEEKPFTQAEICEFLIEPKQTVNSALKKLEAEGYLTLSAGADQRSKRVCLTEKGERFVKAHIDRVPEAEAAALGAMTAAERDALIRLTGRYRALFAQKLNCI